MYMHKNEPSDILIKYYKALYRGKLDQVKALMTSDSYMMTLESFGLRLALRDEQFKKHLNNLENQNSLKSVEFKLSKELISREKDPVIEIRSIESNGFSRQTIHFREDGKEKVLYFSKSEGEDWKIDYYAGRKVA